VVRCSIIGVLRRQFATTLSRPGFIQSSNIAIAPSSAVKSIPDQFLHLDLEWLIDSLQLWTADKFEYGERHSSYGFVFLTTMQSTVAIGEAPAAAMML